MIPVSQSRPLVSILIPAFNCEEWIEFAISSALGQIWANKEIIVVDDGSSDGTLDVIRRFDGRIHWETGSNKGGGAARNRLLELSKGEWLQYLDADDYLLPDKISRQLEFARRHSDADIICNQTLCERLIDGKFVCTETRFPSRRDPWVLLALWELPQTGGPIWKRAALELVKGWRADQPCCQEHELYGRLLEAGCSFAFGEDCLAVYRVWDLGGRLVQRMILEVPRQRLIILDRMETFLSNKGEFTKERRQAVNDARHELARGLWQHDRDLAISILHRIRESDRFFIPGNRPASPLSYRLAYRALGFRGAEWLANLRREFASGFSRQAIQGRS